MSLPFRKWISAVPESSAEPSRNVWTAITCSMTIWLWNTTSSGTFWIISFLKEKKNGNKRIISVCSRTKGLRKRDVLEATVGVKIGRWAVETCPLEGAMTRWINDLMYLRSVILHGTDFLRKCVKETLELCMFLPRNKQHREQLFSFKIL